MNQTLFNINNNILRNYSNILLGIVADLQQIINNSSDDLIIKRLSNVIIQMNNIINDNKKNTEIIINHISSLENQIAQMTKKIDELKINK